MTLYEQALARRRAQYGHVRTYSLADRFVAAYNAGGEVRAVIQGRRVTGLLKMTPGPSPVFVIERPGITGKFWIVDSSTEIV